MDAAQIVVSVVRDIALQGTYGASLEELWSFTEAALPGPLDDQLKRAVWSWVTRHPQIIATDNGVPLQQDAFKPLDELLNRALRVYATEAEQWMALTGREKERNPVGTYPFELLCAVSRSREKGLTSVEIHRLTGQDPRSIFGRVQLLASLGLVKRYPVTKDSAHTHLVIFADFCSNMPETEESTVNKTRLHHEVVSMAKESPQELIVYSEVYRRLGLDKKKHGAKVLAHLCNALEVKGCIRRVQVHSPNNPLIHFKCIKFLKDIEGDLPEMEDDEDEDEEIVYQQVDLAGVVEVDSSLTRYNSFWPLETQIYALVKESGTSGTSAMEILRLISGESWRKVMSLLLPMFAFNEKEKQQYSWVALDRGLDFIQKLKYYRYFTRINLCLYQNKPVPNEWGYFSDIKQAKKTLRDLNISHSTISPGNSAIIKDKQGRIRPLFHGEKIPGVTLLQNDQGGKKRGRPKKSGIADPPVEYKPAYVPQRSSLAPVAQREFVGGSACDTVMAPTQQLQTAADSGDTKPSITATALAESGSSNSLAMKKRIEAITAILDRNNGAVEGSVNLCRLIDEHLQEGKTLDRKTLKKVLAIMEESKLIRQLTVEAWSLNGHFVSRQIVYWTNAKPEVVQLLSDQIKSRLQARRNLGQSTTELPQQEVQVEEVQRLFDKVESKPQRFKRLIQQSLRAKKKKEKPVKMRYGPRASSLVNIPGRSDPRQFVERNGPGARPLFENPDLKRPAEEPLPLPEKPIDDDLLFRCVIIARTLYGKHENSIDWDLVTSCISGLKPRRARQRWISLRDSFGGSKAVQKVQYQWETLFIKHYEAGKIKLVDRYVSEFDMMYYVKFWRKHYANILASPLWRHSHSRLLSRKDYEDTFGALKVKSVVNPLDVVASMPSMVKVDEHLVGASYSYDLNAVAVGSKFTDDELLVRQICGSEEHDVEQAEKQLLQVGEERVKAATESLQKRKMVMYIPRSTEKVVPGRNYTFTDKMLSNLSYRFSDDMWRVAREYEAISGIVEPAVLDNQMVALLELCAMGVISLKRPNIRTGRITSNYQSRGISQELLNFDIALERNEPIPNDPQRPPYPMGPKLVWGPKLFESVAKKLITIIQSKPGVPKGHLYDYLAGFTSGEVDAAIDWLGFKVERRNGGYYALPRWYRAFDS